MVTLSRKQVNYTMKNRYIAFIMVGIVLFTMAPSTLAGNVTSAQGIYSATPSITPSFTRTPTSTATPPYNTYTALPPRYTFTPSRFTQRRNPGVSTATPTHTPSSTVIAPNKAALESFYRSLPQSMAGLRVVTYDQRFDAQISMVSFALEGKNGERFTVRIEIYETEAPAYDRFRFFEQVLTAGRSAGIGTESLVEPDHPNRPGAMRYGNVFVALLRNSIAAEGEKNVPLSERAIVEILQSVYERIRKL